MMLQTLDPKEVNGRSTLFDTTTSVVPDPDEPGRFSVYLDPAWSSLVGVHGGYLAALAIKAAQVVVGDRPIRTVTTSFLRPAHAGRAERWNLCARVGRSAISRSRSRNRRESSR
ncbi:MAG: thioesterase family protein [Actinomycetota bacterium]|nr:thioesterase family protein [Actinomycetota bacterium]